MHSFNLLRSVPPSRRAPLYSEPCATCGSRAAHAGRDHGYVLPTLEAVEADVDARYSFSSVQLSPRTRNWYDGPVVEADPADVAVEVDTLFDMLQGAVAAVPARVTRSRF
jgi:hypothetical protein